MQGLSVLKIFLRLLSMMVMQTLSKCSMVEQLCREVVPEDYEVYKTPNGSIPGKPLNVFIGFQVLDIGEINEEKMEYHLHLYIVYAWNDSRLMLDQFTNLGRPGIFYADCTDYMWIPDMYFETAKAIQTFAKTSPTKVLNILPDKSIIITHRFSFKADCAMEFDDYPFDTQRCQFLIALMYSHDGIAKLKWMDDKDSPFTDPPITMMRELDLLQFYLLEPSTSTYIKTNKDGKHSKVNFTTLVAEFGMLRRLTGCIINTFAPSVLIVIMSWITFWLRLDAIPARTALSITSLLTVCTQSQQSKSQLPAINYMTAMDIWLFMCIISVFSTLLETATSYNIFSRKCKACRDVNKKDPKKVDQNTDKEISKEHDKEISTIRSMKKENTPWVVNTTKKPRFVNSSNDSSQTDSSKGKDCVCFANQRRGQQVDEMSRIAFPACFFTGSIIYFCYYLHRYNNNV